MAPERTQVLCRGSHLLLLIKLGYPPSSVPRVRLCTAHADASGTPAAPTPPNPLPFWRLVVTPECAEGIGCTAKPVTMSGE
jgi:hypothetical protein